MAEGTTSSRQLVLSHLSRIERFDPLFGAIRALVPDAIEQAEASDEYRSRHGPRSPLEGIPVIIKDNIDIAGQPTTAGAVALAASTAAADAHLLRRVREAGAVILAKANLSELAHVATHDEYTEARRRDRDSVTAALEAALGDADALIFRAEEGATWAARSGWPSISIPIGYSRRSRRPLGLTLVTRAWTEPRLLSLAAAIEEVCGFRSPPSEVNPAVFVSRDL